MKKFLTILFVLFMASTISNFAIEIAKDLSGLKLPENPLVAPESKQVTLPKINAGEKVYMLFDNMDPEVSNVISNYYELLYYDIYKKWPAPDYNYYDFMLKAPYSDATLSQYKLTDFDVAIFPMGSYPLNYSTSGGIKVIDKIKEMLDAGKGVMVIGRYWVSYAFHPDGAFAAGKDPAVVSFLSEKIGINGTKAGVISIVSGNTYLPYHIESVEGDPCAKGYDYYCNIGYGRNVEPLLPLFLRPYLDVFTLKTDANGIGFSFMDKYGKTDGDPNVEPGIWVGVRAQVGDGKIAMWSLAPDNIALNETPFFTYCEQFAMDWLTKDLMKVDQWLDLESSLVDFRESLLDNEKVREVKIRNFGKKPLTIKSVYWNGWEDAGTFRIIDGGKPGIMAPGEVRTIKLGFTPTQARPYEDQLFIESDAVNGATKAINCKGIGGKDAPTGPEISVPSNAFDYGTVEIPNAPVKDIFFSSVGTAPVIVDNIEFFKNDGKAFSFAKNMTFPQVIDAGKNYTFEVKFNPTDYGTTYNATLKITSNAKKNFTAYINLTGKSKGSGQGPQISSSLTMDTLDFGRVKPETEKTVNFSILSTGKDILRINKFYLKDDNDVYLLPDSVINKTELDIAPSSSFVIPVTFKPWADGDTYYAQFGMFVNTDAGNFIVNFKGIGDNKVGVKNETESKFANLQLKAYPNPAGNDFTLEVVSQNLFFNSSLNIYDLQGKFVANIFKGNLSIGINNFELNTNGLVPGQYFIGIQTNTESEILPFMIVK